jgi:hypothetical protein
MGPVHNGTLLPKYKITLKIYNFKDRIVYDIPRLDVSKRLELITQAIELDTTDSSLILLTEILLPHQFKDIIELTLQPFLNLS